jgi:hypothetical protein
MLGYFAIFATSINSPRYMGGLLITDEAGLPVDFRYTEPVIPTRLQQVLYGQGMAHYIKTQVILPTLLAECAEHQLTYVFTEDAALLHAQPNVVNLVSLKPTQLDPLDERMQPLGDTECLLQVQAAIPPIKVCWQVQQQADTLHNALFGLSQHMMVLEPFERVNTALKMLAQEMAMAA